MYRRSRKYQQLVANAAKKRARLEKTRLLLEPTEYPPTLPELRRIIVITDYDTGTPVTHKIELYRSNRIDCYNAWVDGKLWKKRIGWSKVLEGLRKTLPRRRELD